MMPIVDDEADEFNHMVDDWVKNVVPTDSSSTSNGSASVPLAGNPMRSAINPTNAVPTNSSSTSNGSASVTPGVNQRSSVIPPTNAVPTNSSSTSNGSASVTPAVYQRTSAIPPTAPVLAVPSTSKAISRDPRNHNRILKVELPPSHASKTELYQRRLISLSEYKSNQQNSEQSVQHCKDVLGELEKHNVQMEVPAYIMHTPFCTDVRSDLNLVSPALITAHNRPLSCTSDSQIGKAHRPYRHLSENFITLLRICGTDIDNVSRRLEKIVGENKDNIKAKLFAKTPNVNIQNTKLSIETQTEPMTCLECAKREAKTFRTMGVQIRPYLPVHFGTQTDPDTAHKENKSCAINYDCLSGSSDEEPDVRPLFDGRRPQAPICSANTYSAPMRSLSEYKSPVTASNRTTRAMSISSEEEGELLSPIRPRLNVQQTSIRQSSIFENDVLRMQIDRMHMRNCISPIPRSYENYSTSFREVERSPPVIANSYADSYRNQSEPSTSYARELLPIKLETVTTVTSICPPGHYANEPNKMKRKRKIKNIQ